MIKMFLMRRSSVLYTLSACLMLALGLGGCGYKDMPVAPQALVPEAINDLRYELTDNGIILHWHYPTRTVNGEDITEIDSFLLYRAEVPTASYCADCPVPFGSPVKLAGGNIPEREGRREAAHEVTQLRPAHRYFFKIHSRTGWMTTSADSNVVSFIWQTPPAVPEGLAADLDDNRVVLRWQPVTAYSNGTPIDTRVTYQVSRSIGGAAFEDAGSLLTSAEYADTEVSGGNTYAYRVRALIEYDADTVAGDFTEPLEVRVVDQTPPAPPENVKTARTAVSVKIFWDQGTEEDLAGYRVYRRLGSETTPEMIGVVEVPYNIYEDVNAPEKDVPVYYSVTAFDGSEPPNESEHSEEATVR